jgi:MFS family permease
VSARLRGKGAVVSALGIAQTLSWASSYYLPAVLADPIAMELGLSRDRFFGIFSASLLLSGLLGPIAGHAIDRRGGRDVLAATNLVFAIGLTILAFASGLTSLALAWAILGCAMGFGLYEAAFATATGLYGRDARNAITGITLFAGFASTIGWPATAFFAEIYGWRGACLIWAALHILVGLPLNRLVVPKAPAPAPIHAAAPGADAASTPRAMWILAMVFAACWFVSTAMAAHLPRLVQAIGATPALAIAAGAMIGPAQVAARLMEYGLLQRFPPMTSARLSGLLHPIGAAIVTLFGAPAALVFAGLHGAGNGLLTIARGTLPLALFGPAGYGLRTGIIAAPARILQGVAPLLFGIILDRAGPYWALALSSSLTFGAFLALFLIRPPAR